jgi:hypothetical protein
VGYGQADSGFDFQLREENFVFSKSVQTGCGQTQPCMQWVLGVIFAGLTRY